LPEVVIGGETLQEQRAETNYPLIIYLAGLIISLGIFIVRLTKLAGISLNNEHASLNGIRLILTGNDLPVFSFFNNVFINRETLSHPDSDKILAHEKVHIEQLHSFDIVAAEILCIVLWFNPFAYFLKKAIRENHEFLADEKVIRKGADPTNYRLLLMEYSTNIQTNSLAHNFSYSLLKRRLHMIKKPKKRLHFGFSVLVAALAFSLAFFACSQPDRNLTPDQSGNDSDEHIVSIAEVMPEYPGGFEAMSVFLTENITYPEAAKNNSTEGKVLVGFVIDKDGTVTDVKTEKGIGDGCDEEAERVIGMMPKWTPGYTDGKAVMVSLKLPVMFSLDHASKDSVYKVVKTMPEYPGGINELLNYIGQNINYPEEAKKDSIQGKVFVQFVIEKDGSVSGTKILRGIGSGCDEESLRVINAMPKWKPGLDEEGNAVRVEYTIPIKYTLR
jgi:TonB family protein